MERGDQANVSVVELGTHSGTHVDPPAHFIPGGATVDRLPLDAMIGEALVVDPPDLESLPAGAERLLVRTAGSGSRISLARAGELIALGVRLVGIDAPSVEEEGAPEHPVHRAFLEAGVVLLENLDLSDAAAGRYTLLCLPLRIEGGDGAPARAVLIEK
jgi:arylformamidase